MKKVISILVILLVCVTITGCGCSKDNDDKNKTATKTEENSVMKDQIFEGLEFVNTSAQGGNIETVVINNTGVTYEGSKFSIKVKDKDANTIVELVDEVKEPMETGTTKTIVTKTDANLKNAYVIEYGIVNE